MMGRIILLALAVLLLAGGGIMIVYPDKYISDVDRKTMSGADLVRKKGELRVQGMVMAVLGAVVVAAYFYMFR
ncbi:MAG: hypothetical protein LIP16_18910 [Clostridium sp.]|nr:hypothetical protein [Clostridium sp.]